MNENKVRALVVGIDSYPHLDPDRKLRGAVADARAIAKLLRGRVPNIDLVSLIESEATREGVLDALDVLAVGAQQGDELIFHWSGHGSQVKDISGDDEDGWDETLVPQDSGRGSKENRDILDDEIRSCIESATAGGARFTFIVDSCHSGTVVRAGVRGVPRDSRVPIATKVKGGKAAIDRRAQQTEGPRGASGWLPLSDRYLLLAACRDDQEAIELPFDGQYRGVFSWALERELSMAPKGATWRDLFPRVEAEVAFALYGKQIPQLEGARGWAVPG